MLREVVAIDPGGSKRMNVRFAFAGRLVATLAIAAQTSSGLMRKRIPARRGDATFVLLFGWCAVGIDFPLGDCAQKIFTQSAVSATTNIGRKAPQPLGVIQGAAHISVAGLGDGALAATTLTSSFPSGSRCLCWPVLSQCRAKGANRRFQFNKRT